MNQAFTIARKEIVDGLRDVRSLVAALFYALMGPGVVGLVAVATHAAAKADSGVAVLTGMMAVFTLVSAFVGDECCDGHGCGRTRTAVAVAVVVEPGIEAKHRAGEMAGGELFCAGRACGGRCGFSGRFCRGGSAHCWDWATYRCACSRTAVAAVSCRVGTVADFNRFARR